MFIHNINPVLLNLESLEIRYYGLFYVIGFILAYFILQKISKLNKEKIKELLVYSGVAGIIGARLFYILIYNFAYYIKNPFEMLAVWHGGLSFHGSLIGAVIGIYLFSKKYKQNFLYLLDKLSIPLVLGLAIGRIGNFINGELVGRVTNIQWCVDFGDKLCRHPSQLYESLYSFFIFGILWNLRNKKFKNGMIFAFFILLYSTLRFLTEFFRMPDPQIGFILGLTLGQWLNTAMFIIGMIVFYKVK